MTKTRTILKRSTIAADATTSEADTEALARQVADMITPAMVALIKSRTTAANLDERFIDTDDAAEYTTVSLSTINRSVADGTIRSHKIRGNRVFLKSELREDITSGRAAGTDDEDASDPNEKSGD